MKQKKKNIAKIISKLKNELNIKTVLKLLDNIIVFGIRHNNITVEELQNVLDILNNQKNYHKRRLIFSKKEMPTPEDLEKINYYKRCIEDEIRRKLSGPSILNQVLSFHIEQNLKSRNSFPEATVAEPSPKSPLNNEQYFDLNYRFNNLIDMANSDNIPCSDVYKELRNLVNEATTYKADDCLISDLIAEYYLALLKSTANLDITILIGCINKDFYEAIITLLRNRLGIQTGEVDPETQIQILSQKYIQNIVPQGQPFARSLIMPF